MVRQCHCCEIGCDLPAAFWIQGPGGYDDYAHACHLHVEALEMDGCQGVYLLDPLGYPARKVMLVEDADGIS
jgi:hypothetical protein